MLLLLLTWTKGAHIKKREGRMDSEPIKTTRSQFETFPMEVGVSKKESYFQPKSAKIHTATVVSAQTKHWFGL